MLVGMKHEYRIHKYIMVNICLSQINFGDEKNFIQITIIFIKEEKGSQTRYLKTQKLITSHLLISVDIVCLPSTSP